jgi:hypothetical protein
VSIGVLVQCRFGNAHHLADMLDRMLSFLVELYRQRPFIRIERFWTSAPDGLHDDRAENTLDLVTTYLIGQMFGTSTTRIWQFCVKAIFDPSGDQVGVWYSYTW